MSNPGLEIRGGPGHPEIEGGLSSWSKNKGGGLGHSTGTATASIGLINEFLVASLFKGNYQRGGACTPLYGLNRDVLLDRVWFFDLSVLNRVCNFL